MTNELGQVEMGEVCSSDKDARLRGLNMMEG
jgi:hypothetical protein